MSPDIRVDEVFDAGHELLVANYEHDPAHEYRVYLDSDYRPTGCECPHHQYRQAFCKHMVVAGEYADEEFVTRP